MSRVNSPSGAADLLVHGLVRGDERYIVLVRDDRQSVAAALRVLGGWAADPELSLTWRDAALLGKRIVQSSKE